ncbi:MAG TPA: hypothetical protein VNS63_26155 [Blastocatellia bacterium]|nr:hypothetical protein [Blastocatellia bacterium]
MNGLHYKTAFVIRFNPNADFDSGRVGGRVEHVASYKTKRFHSVEELLSFVDCVLKEVRAEEKE